MQGIFFSVLTGICFGLAMFLRKMAVDKIGFSAFIFEAVVEAVIAILIISLLFPFKISQILQKTNGILFGATAGLIMGIGVISFYLAAKNGPVITPSIVSPILASLLATFLAILLIGESISLIRIIGLIVSLTGLFIFISVR